MNSFCIACCFVCHLYFTRTNWTFSFQTYLLKVNALLSWLLFFIEINVITNALHFVLFVPRDHQKVIYKGADLGISLCGGWQPLGEHRIQTTCCECEFLWESAAYLFVEHEDCSRRLLPWWAGQDLRDHRLSGGERRGESGLAALLWRLPSSAKWRRHEVHGSTSKVQNDADILQVSRSLIFHVLKSAR